MKQNKFTNAELSVIAVSRLRGDIKRVNLEDIAIELFIISPSRFSLRKYPEHLDMHTVRVSLSDAQRLNKPRLSGGIKHGYMLSKHGIEWISEIDTKDLDPLLSQDKGRKGSLVSSYEAERYRIRHTVAFRRLSEGDFESSSLAHFFEFLRINEYYPVRKVKERITVIENAVKDDPELKQIWDLFKLEYETELSNYE